jgi:hypothetical protein
MNPDFWRAIDRIGGRKASRFEWESVSSLPWEELAQFLRAAGGYAVEVADPDDPAETLVVWERDDGNCLLESQQIPPHRESIRVPAAALALHRADVKKLCGEMGDLVFGWLIWSAKKGEQSMGGIRVLQARHQGFTRSFMR